MNQDETISPQEALDAALILLGEQLVIARVQEQRQLIADQKLAVVPTEEQPEVDKKAK